MTSPSPMQLHSQAALFFECGVSEACIDTLKTASRKVRSADQHTLQTPPTIKRGFLNARK